MIGGSRSVADEIQLYSQASLKLPDAIGDIDFKEHGVDSLHRKCKIICTMGPSCWEVPMLLQLIDAGLNICRLNFSHGAHDAHGACVQRIREAGAQRPSKPIAILLDTKGPEIRTGFFGNGAKTIDLKAGNDLKLTTDYSIYGNSNCIAVTYQKLPKDVKPGSMILIADGSLSLKVKSCGSDHVITEVMNNCTIGERKNCNLPGVKVDLPVLQEKDIDDIVNFGIPQGVDYVAASFVQSKEDVEFIRTTLGEKGKHIRIISKIENRAGLKNFDDILEASDGIMVARGDLGMEIPPEKVFLAQKIMIAKCNLKGKPVITATQMLESMTKNPRPTRAEAGDVANAVLDGTDCVMLSGETAGGSFPVEAVTVMRKIVEEAEHGVDYGAVYLKTRLDTLKVDFSNHMSITEATCSTAVKTAIDTKSSLIVCLSEHGYGAGFLAKYRPEAAIFAMTPHAEEVRALCYVRGVLPILADSSKTITDLVNDCIEQGKKMGVVKAGDSVIAVHGQHDAIPFGAGRCNMMKMLTVDGERQLLTKSSGSSDCQQASLRLPMDMGDLDMTEHEVASAKRKCKMVCTMGPSCWDVDKLVTLMDCGMSICRLNFSHGDYEGHGRTVKRIREAQAKRPDKKVAILLDTKGPEIRTGFFKDGAKTIDLVKGKELKIVTDYNYKGDSGCIAVTYKNLPRDVKIGSTILIADGSLVLKVKSIGEACVITEILNNCSIGERKNCNLPGVKVDLPVLQDKDIKDLLEFGIPQGVDFVAASFVQSKADVEFIRKTLGDKGKHMKIISKIENMEGLINFDAICEESDGIMVARGDLGMEIPPEKVFLAQKLMIAKCNMLGKPVITATQMLESMTKAPRPTRAEASDVANAILDGTDCVMLSGETAGGDFPVESVTIMRRIVEEAESFIDYMSLYLKTRESVLRRNALMSEREAFASSAVKQATDAGCQVIVVLTETGTSVRLVAKYRPEATILAVTASESTARQLLMLRGVVSAVIPFDCPLDAIVLKALVQAKNMNLCQSGDLAVLCREVRDTGKPSKIITINSVP